MNTNFHEAPKMPELPAMQPMQMTAPQGGGAVMQPQRGPLQAGGRSLRRLMGLITSGGLMMMLAVLGLELIAKDGLRPSQILADFQASHDLEEIRQKNPGLHILNETDYLATVAKAQRQGQLDAELPAQQKMLALQSDVERLNAAYTALYQRGNDIARGAMQMEADLQRARASAVAQGLTGKATSATIHDYLCEFGNVPSCDRARQLREESVTEMNSLATAGQGTTLQQLMGDIADPATVVVKVDFGLHGSPSIPR